MFGIGTIPVPQWLDNINRSFEENQIVWRAEGKPGAGTSYFDVLLSAQPNRLGHI